jgi:cytochrome c oxidase assembly factor CtaG
MPLFAFLVMTGDTYYPTYIDAPRLLAMTPLQDQAIGGIFMKILGEVVFGTYLFLAFMEWYRKDNRGHSVPSAAPSQAAM